MSTDSLPSKVSQERSSKFPPNDRSRRDFLRATAAAIAPWVAYPALGSARFGDSTPSDHD